MKILLQAICLSRDINMVSATLYLLPVHSSILLGPRRHLSAGPPTLQLAASNPPPPVRRVHNKQSASAPSTVDFCRSFPHRCSTCSRLVRRLADSRGVLCSDWFSHLQYILVLSPITTFTETKKNTNFVFSKLINLFVGFFAFLDFGYY